METKAKLLAIAKEYGFENLLFCDLETYSGTPLKHGTHRYAEDAEVLLWAYALNDGTTKVWDRASGEYMPADLARYLSNPKTLTVWHNGAMFDNTILKHAAPSFHLPVERIHDTMVQALTHGLPGALGTLCEVMGVPADKAKDKRGRQLINLFCKPRPKNVKLDRATKETHPEEWQAFVEYAAGDIEAMRELILRMPRWNYRGYELELWRLDQTINNRGVTVDLELAQAAIDSVNRAQKVLAARTAEITNGEVAKTTQRDKLLAYLLSEHGVDLPDMQQSTLERRIADTSLPWALRELLSIRLQASSTSVSKLKVLTNATSSDGRLRGLLQFCGAARTGRWAGRTFQPQNLPSKNILEWKDIQWGITTVLTGTEDLFFDDVMKVSSSLIRSCLVASRGKKLFVSDLANIEGRDAAWLAGEEWKLQAFRDFDEGTGPDLYSLAYAKAFKVTPEEVMENKKAGGNWRQIGKVMELALGYEGGVGAFITFSLVYNIDLDEMAAGAVDGIPERIWAETGNAWSWAVEKKRTFGLEQQTWRVCDAFKRLWREAHPEISSYWKELENKVQAAILQPGRTISCRKLKIHCKGAWLRIILPSGRSLCYASPRLEGGKISYMGVNSYTRRWQRIYTYGGKLFENVCQAVARDVMAENMPMMEMLGYEILLTVHDEVVTEAPDNGDFSSDELGGILSTNPVWAPDLPLAAGGFESNRYRKD